MISSRCTAEDRRRLAEAGNPQAQYEHALRTKAERPEWLRRAVAQGHTAAKGSLGKHLVDSGEAARGVPLLREAAVAGDFWALWWLGDCYLFGLGVARANDQAAACYRAALVQATGFDPLDIPLYRLAQAEAGAAPADAAEPPPDELIAFLEQAAEAGNPQAIFALARRADDGFGVPNDHRKARDLYERAAEQDYPLALLALAAKGGSPGMTPEQAPSRAGLALYRRAAELGCVEAWCEYGHELVFSDDAANRRSGAVWLERAVKLGWAEASRHLGKAVVEGQFGAPDLAAARRHFECGAALGDLGCVKILETPEDQWFDAEDRLRLQGNLSARDLPAQQLRASLAASKPWWKFWG